MGVWDFICSTIETVKRNAPDLRPVKDACVFWKIDDAVRVNGIQILKKTIPDEQGRAQIILLASDRRTMGVWDFICSTTETVLRPVSDASKAIYAYGSAVFWKIDNAVRVDSVQILNTYMLDEQSRAQITLFTSKLVRNAGYHCFKEAYNLFPGGKPMAKIISETIREVRSENRKKRDGEEVVLERNVIDHAEMQGKGVKLGYEKGISADSASNQTPKDIEFIGSHLDDLIIPQKRLGMARRRCKVKTS